MLLLAEWVSLSFSLAFTFLFEDVQVAPDHNDLVKKESRLTTDNGIKNLIGKGNLVFCSVQRQS